MSKTHPNQASLFLWQNDDSPYKDKLHRLYMLEVNQTKEWLRKNYPTFGDKKKLPLLYVAWAASIEGEQPELMVRFYLTSGQLKNTTIPAIAEFIVIRDIDYMINDEIQNIKPLLERLYQNINNELQIDINYYAEELRVSKKAIEALCIQIKKGAV